MTREQFENVHWHREKAIKCGNLVGHVEEVDFENYQVTATFTKKRSSVPHSIFYGQYTVSCEMFELYGN